MDDAAHAVLALARPQEEATMSDEPQQDAQDAQDNLTSDTLLRLFLTVRLALERIEQRLLTMDRRMTAMDARFDGAIAEELRRAVDDVVAIYGHTGQLVEVYRNTRAGLHALEAAVHAALARLERQEGAGEEGRG